MPYFIVYRRGSYFCLLISLFPNLSYDPCSVLTGGVTISAFFCLCYIIIGMPNFIVDGRGTDFCLLIPLFHHLSYDPSSVLTGGVTISAFFAFVLS